MLHKDDVLVASHEADVILDVLEKGAPQGGDLDVAQWYELPGQCLVDALQAALVVEDVSEERILVCTFGLHLMSPFYGDYTMKLVGKED